MSIEHRPGCDALGGYGYGVGPCTCGATPASGDEPALSDERIRELFEQTKWPSESFTVRAADFARAVIAADRAARQAPVVPAGEPVVTVKRGARTPWGYAGVVVLWGPGLQDLPPGLHQLYAAPSSPLQQAQDGERDTERLDWLLDALSARALQEAGVMADTREAIDAAIQSDAARKEGEKG